MLFGKEIRKTLVILTMWAAVVAGIVVLAPQTAKAEDRPVKSKVSPTYPELAKKIALSGTVKLEATVAPNGQVRAVKVIGGHPLLAGAAEDALRRWKYEAAPSESTVVVEFHFSPAM